MSFIKKSILFTFIFSMFLSVAYAVSFDAEAVPIDNKIIIDEFATFQISIKNN